MSMFYNDMLNNPKGIKDQQLSGKTNKQKIYVICIYIFYDSKPSDEIPKGTHTEVNQSTEVLKNGLSSCAIINIV